MISNSKINKRAIVYLIFTFFEKLILREITFDFGSGTLNFAAASGLPFPDLEYIITRNFAKPGCGAIPGTQR